MIAEAFQYVTQPTPFGTVFLGLAFYAGFEVWSARRLIKTLRADIAKRGDSDDPKRINLINNLALSVMKEDGVWLVADEEHGIVARDQELRFALDVAMLNHITGQDFSEVTNG